jgi:subtilisin family serine protease
MVDFGDGKSTQVSSAGAQGGAQNSRPVVGVLAYAGLGKPADFTGVNLRGKVALIQRGEITFREKVEGALKNGAIGVLIFNNAAGVARGSVGESPISIPVAMIEQTVGERLKQALSQGKTATGSVVTEESDYDSYDGTSMATPHVSGVVALIRAANKSLSPAQVRDVLAKSSAKMGTPDETGAGMLDAEAAVNVARASRALEPELELAVGF